MKDFSEERRIKILEEIKKEGKVFVNNLVKEFKVSDTTIRRDLDELVLTNLIIRTHGGAIIKNLYFPDSEIEIEDRKALNLNEKKKIAKKALDFINEGDLILISGGSTTLELAKLLGKFNNLKIITNSLEIAVEIAKNNNIELIIIGGKLNRISSILTGIDTINYLSTINVDKLFFSVSGIDINKGLTNPIGIDAEIHAKMIESAKLKYLLVDASKFGKVYMKKIYSINVINKIITDSRINSNIIREIEPLGIDVIII